MKQGKRRAWKFLFYAALLFLLDVVTKYWVETHLLKVDYAYPFYPYGGIGIFQNFLGIDFTINRISNAGGAWGIFSSYPIALLYLRIGIIFSLFIYTIFFNKERKKSIPLMLILLGASANVLDFFIYGSVVDMFHFMLGNYSFPVFNVADMMIFFGVSTLLIQSMMEKFKPAKRSHAYQSSEN